MSRNIVPRANKDADLGTPAKNWNKLYADTVILRGSDLHALLNGKTDLNTLTAKGDLYVATDAGIITRLPAGEDGYVLKSNSGITEGLMWGPAGARQELTGNMTVTVGDGGDFPTINAALENIVALYYPKYISGRNCPRVTIHLLPCFVMSEQVFVESLDLSWITIEGEDVETVINRAALSIPYVTGEGRPAFAAINGGFLPIIGQLFNMDTSSVGAGRSGIVVYNNSRAIILPDCGIKNAGSDHSYGILATRSSIVNANSTIFSGTGGSGICATQGSTINANNADASGASEFCIAATQGSTINASSANASGSGMRNIYAKQNSTIDASSADASGASEYCIAAIQNSTINANSANASGSGMRNIYAMQGSTINANNADASGASEYCIAAMQGSTINASSANASGSGKYGIAASYGSIINAYNADASEAGIDYYGIIVTHGSIINACGATGTLSQTKNTITISGIIFK